MSKETKGFTLIEAVIYAAILAIISVLVVNSILMLTKSFGNLRLSRNINNSAVTALERITREIRLADDINVGASNFGVHPGRLTLNTVNPDTEAATTVEFSVSATTLMIKEGIGEAQALTSSKAEVVNLIFRQLAGSDISKAIRIELEIRAGQKSEKFYNTVVLRRAY